jgi:LuxR family maltose regulon positive regulatory protein
MTGPLLETKLYVPKARRELVARPRLSERLGRGAESKLTLISAPAGFGKTTLLGDWLETRPATESSSAWLSLDQSDNDPASFWTYFVAALRKAVPSVGAAALSLLQSPQPPIMAALTALLNELSLVPKDVVLVLDDYHVIDALDVQEGMAFLLEHLPPRVHVVIATRADPGLPLPRLRARGELVEIRAADLRFTPDEAASYLNEVMGLNLAAEDVAALEDRTEGWIAALQLAALSMQGRDDVSDFIAGFAGDDRYIVDYLVTEVLQRQPEAVRGFLLETSILDRLTGPLCDAVTGQDHGKATLEALERANLFVVPLDGGRRWYRYHHLFADVLRAHLLDEQPERMSLLHRRASDWYEQNDGRSDAIRHALAAHDFPRAAHLIELAFPAMRRSRQESVLLGWLKALPDELLRNRPVLNIAYAASLLASGQFDGAEARVLDAQRWLDTTATGSAAESGAMVVVDTEEYRRLPASIAMYRAVRAQVRGDVTAALDHARHALDLVREDDHLVHAGASQFMALVSWANGDLESAHVAYVAAVAALRLAGHVSDTFGCAIAIADILITQGHLHHAMDTYEQALQLAAQGDLRGTADMHVGMSQIYRERGDLTAATQHLLKSQELGEYSGLPQNRHRWRIAMARVRESQGDLDGAVELLNEAERLYEGDYFPNVRPIGALRARVWIAQGRYSDALAWARTRDLAATDDLSYLREFEHITLARALLAKSRSDRADGSIREATGLLSRLLVAAEAGARTGNTTEILLLQALAHQMRSDIPAALVALGRARTLAEPEGYVRVFVDEGAPMVELLQEAAKQRISPSYVHRLLAAFGTGEGRSPVKLDLAEPLTGTELEVLRLLRSDLNGPAIARELVVSLNTVRTHTRNIYTKLGVNDRRAAVRRAEELDGSA